MIKVLSKKIRNNFNLSYQVAQYCFISSFDHDCLERFQKHDEGQVRCVYLHTRKITDILPGADVTSAWDCGTNIQTSAATQEVVNRFHLNGQLVMVWVDKLVTPDEGPELWKKIIESGADCFCTDHPLEFL